jgi:hypothetical protein
MEARSTLHGTGLSKGLIAIVAILAAFVLAAAGGYIAKSLASQSVPAAHVATTSAGASDSVWSNRARRSGSQSVEGPTVPTYVAPNREGHGQ